MEALVGYDDGLRGPDNLLLSHVPMRDVRGLLLRLVTIWTDYVCARMAA